MIQGKLMFQGRKLCKGGIEDYDCCTVEDPCGRGEGDCDKDRECKDDLICGKNNCRKHHPAAQHDADCCDVDLNAGKSVPVQIQSKKLNIYIYNYNIIDNHINDKAFSIHPVRLNM